MAHYRKLRRASQKAERLLADPIRRAEAMKEFWALADSWPEWK